MTIDKSYIAPWSTTGIGSLPFTSARQAAEFSLQSLDIPFWPQLPNLSGHELMIPQYSEGMPSLCFDGKGEPYVDRNEEEIARFYETCGPESKIAISEDYAKGFYAFMQLIKARRFKFLKGHITGPLTFTLGLNDRAGRPIYFDEELREISLMLLGAKARWQIYMLGQFAEGVIVFIDEPILSALGTSSYMGVTNEEALRLLRDAASAIRQAGGIPAIHSCGRADWPLVIDSGIDILNFDAYDYGDTLTIFPEELNAFLARGGKLAWGIVPTNEKISEVDSDGVRRMLDARISAMSKFVPEALIRQNIMLTPSCGTGSRTPEETTKIFQILMRLKEDYA